LISQTSHPRQRPPRRNHISYALMRRPSWEPSTSSPDPGTGASTCGRNVSGSSVGPACSPGPSCSTTCGRRGRPNWPRAS
jgi:hypothetical protein